MNISLLATTFPMLKKEYVKSRHNVDHWNGMILKATLFFRGEGKILTWIRF